MGFLDNLTKKTTETTSKIAKKTTETTSKIAKETKLKFKINDNKGKIKSLYEEIGKKIYENHLNDIEENDETIKENCEKIDELSAEIEEARKEILTLNNIKICPKCFAEIEKDAAFCSKCGEKQEDLTNDTETIEEETKQEEVFSNNEENKDDE